MIKNYAIDILKILIFIGFFELMARTLKRVISSSSFLRNSNGEIQEVKISKVVVFPFFMTIQALWFLLFSFDFIYSAVSVTILCGFLGLWLTAWLFTQYFIFPKWLHFLNQWLSSRTSTHLIKFARLTIGLILMLLVAIAIVIKFQSTL
ncbi:MAG: hypothetical protein MRY21_07830 [Simkaniaceae bacterium]|nr:hypothetical protein [Simkaniaceae bacterium]